MNIVEFINQQTGIDPGKIKKTINLIEDGATIPFIARYRKEATGGLDEVEITKIKESLEKYKELESRKEYIISAIEKQGKLTEELKIKILQTFDLTILEDIYLPFRKKRRSRAEIAKQKGLEPLAKIIFDQGEIDLDFEAKKYIKKSEDENLSVNSVEEALEGARHIIAEWVNEDTKVREDIRALYEKSAVITSVVKKSKKDEASKFEDYFDFTQSLRNIPSHRLLAIRRGENEGYLRVSLNVSESKALGILEEKFIKSDNESALQVKLSIEDSFKRLLSASMGNEFAKLSKEQADDEAISVFVENLKQLLLAPPLGEKSTIAIDPGFRTGCKLVLLDEHGNLKFNTVIFPDTRSSEAKKVIEKIIEKFDVKAIAIGNGTASRETEDFVRGLNTGIDIFVVNESGASIYSASEVAREEFPDEDITVRGAVSIGRRLMDPLAELVKIDPKSIGVGQYQHDVDQNKLKANLDRTVESCVNLVGVNLNTASKHLLTYVSGLGPAIAQNIIDYRSKNGEFKSRKQLLKVSKLGPKAFEQCAGFLRIRNAKNPLDNSSVHPESYKIVENMAKNLSVEISDLIGNDSLVEKIDIENYITDDIGLPTLEDIKSELLKPGLDPRGEVEIFNFKEGVTEIDDLEVGMVLPGIITNITNFGAFVDIGVHQDGLVHISKLSNEYVSNPTDIVSLSQKVEVKVLEIDKDRKRISLSMVD